jgi:hypothetical protein
VEKLDLTTYDFVDGHSSEGPHFFSFPFFLLLFFFSLFFSKLGRQLLVHEFEDIFMFHCLLQDLVTWVTLGTFHIPHLENTPNTATTGTTLSLFLAPFNFFPEDPSMASRDAVRVTPRDPSNTKDAAVVERYNTSSLLTCIPDVKSPEGLLEDTELFS